MRDRALFLRNAGVFDQYRVAVASAEVFVEDDGPARDDGVADFDLGRGRDDYIIVAIRGAAGAIRPIEGEGKMVLLLPFLVAVSVLMAIVTQKDIKKWAGVLLLSLYFVFLVMLMV